MISQAEIPARTPPQNVEAEQALLGAILANNNALEKVSEFLKPVHFASPVHAAIYQAIVTLHARGHIADPVTLKGYLANDGLLDEVGGVKYLMDLAATAMTIINVEDYGKLVFDRYLRRQLINIGTDVVNDAYAVSLENDALTQMSQAENKLYKLSTEGQVGGGPQQFHAALDEVLQEIAEARKNPDGLSGVPTGFRDLDRKMSGLHNSDLIILAGRPGMGKTAFATCLAFNTARSFMNDVKERRGVAFFSLEMSSAQLAGRILAMETQISSEKLRSGKITEDEWRRIATFAGDLEKVPLYVDDTPGLNVTQIHNRCRRMKGLGLIVIDYLQLIDMSDSAYKGDMVRGLTETTRRLKIMAKDLNVPVLVLSQLNRAVEQRDDKRPQLADLRDSGSIEQDADIVMFVFREHYYLKNGAPVQKQNETEDRYNERLRKWEKDLVDLEKKATLIIAKQRHGSVGDIDLSFEGQFTRFGDWIEQE